MSEPENAPIKPEPKKEGIAALADAFKGADPTTKLILVAVVFLGGGNFLQGLNSNHEQRREIETALKEIHELRAALDPLSARQGEILNLLKELQKPK